MNKGFRMLVLFIVSATLVARGQHNHQSAGQHSMKHSMAAHQHAMGAMNMEGVLGGYPMTREGSGTSWQPELVPAHDKHFMARDWMFMAHGFAYGIYDNQGGKRGDEKFFSANMLMLMGQRPVGEGKFGIRTMFSLEPATIGRNGYPELLQTGETGNGRDELIDRQHPHDLFMELALSYSHPLREDSSAFVYFGLPGEPALGPTTFMHRLSGIDNPEAPITHHWLDSTHITFGVATVGYIWKNLKFDASAFTGREPDQERWDIERPRFDSYSVRLSYNPAPSWAFQVSYGWLNGPEQLEPGVDTDRITASVSYHKTWSSNHWATTFAWGENRDDPGEVLDGFLLESALVLHETHTVFARAERVDKAELFRRGDPFEGETFTVNKVSGGYIYDFRSWHHIKFGVGGVGSIHLLPGKLTPSYGETPLSFMLFVRAKL